jgi:hypothetical protein
MTTPLDDLEAIRKVVQALEPFDPKDRERIIRWASEKLGMTAIETAPKLASVPSMIPPSLGATRDIKSFVAQKKPQSDNHLAAVVAYYYQFEAPPSERKNTIGKEELIEACRRADRNRPARPEQVLVNSYHAGFFDKTGRGQYRLNSVGENLVAMVLPEKQESKATSKKKPQKRTKRNQKRIVKSVRASKKASLSTKSK